MSSRQVSSFTPGARGESAAPSSSFQRERERERGGGTDREECKPATERMRDREIGAAQQ